MIKKIVLAVLVLIAAVLLYAATRPDAIHVERSVVVNAPPEKIFPFINDFHSWKDWSPYETLDPAMKKTFSGSPSGVGAVYEWAGNNDVGEGRMEITSAAPERIIIKLDFLKPFEGHNTATFTLAPENAATRVTWAMDGASPFVAKVMGIFVDMDKMIGKDFATGLTNLKTIAER
jgi:hypothetical protein